MDAQKLQKETRKLAEDDARLEEYEHRMLDVVDALIRDMAYFLSSKYVTEIGTSKKKAQKIIAQILESTKAEERDVSTILRLVAGLMSFNRALSSSLSSETKELITRLRSREDLLRAVEALIERLPNQDTDKIRSHVQVLKRELEETNKLLQKEDSELAA